MLEYLNETQMTSLEHINTITIYSLSKYMSLDINARRNLEITEKMRDKSKMRDRFVKKYTANILDVKILYV